MNGLERLYYSNGQRLAATELRLEQRYHVDVRRLLTRGLFTAGVVAGLEVTTATARSVIVAAGLALDPLGRELYVDEATTLAVPNQPPTNRTLAGYYLTVRYDEQPVEGDGDACSPGVIPTLVRQAPLLEWTEEWPDPSRAGQPGRERDAAIVIALVALDAACEIGDVRTGFREYAHPRHTTQVSAVSFEGEKDIDATNPKRLHFEISGGPPTSVVLALWGERLSSLFYTELGRHGHELESIELTDATVTLAEHTHGLPAHTHRTTTDPVETTGRNQGHFHQIRTVPDNQLAGHDAIATTSYANAKYQPNGQDAAGNFKDSFLLTEGQNHHHEVSVSLGEAVDSNNHSTLTETGATQSRPSASHTHALKSPAQVDDTGQPGYDVRSGSAHTYLADLDVALDGVSITDRVRQFLGWPRLGTGGQDTQLNGDDGTGPVDLVLDLGLSLEEGSHRLDFSVGDGGGKLLYNLYVR